MAWFRNTILAAIAAVVLSEIDSVPFTWGTVSEVVVLFLFAEDHLLSKTSGIGQNATCARSPPRIDHDRCNDSVPRTHFPSGSRWGGWNFD